MMRRIQPCSKAAGALRGQALARGIVGLVLVAAGSNAPSLAEESHLPFFSQNRDFLLRAFEHARLQQPPEGRTQAWEFDPFAEWSVSARVQAARAALDTATAPEHLGAFHAALGDLLDEAEAAAARLDSLDQRFAAHLRTAVEVTVETAAPVHLQRIEAHLDGKAIVAREISPAERQALEAGGVLEILRRVVEVRNQDLQLRWYLEGETEPRLLQQEISPVPDALVRLHLRLSARDEPARLVQSTLGGG